MSVQQEKFKAIADKIREKTSASDLIKPYDFASKIDEVYEAGKQSEYDEFWDKYQDNGNRTDYVGAFMGRGWTEHNFNPKYKIEPENAYMMFAYNKIEDLKSFCESSHISLDFSKCSNLQYIWFNSSVKKVGKIDTTSAARILLTFQGSTIEEIELLKLREAGDQQFSLVFQGCGRLKNIVIEGKIGQDGLDFSPCPLLSKSSIENVINSLLDSAEGKTLTLSLTSVNNAFETADGLADGSSSAAWIELITPKSNQYDGNWTISLI